MNVTLLFRNLVIYMMFLRHIRAIVRLTLSLQHMGCLSRRKYGRSNSEYAE